MASSTVLALALSALSAACLDDLPEATTCPAPAKLPSKDCTTAQAPVGCTQGERLAGCFGRASCDCASAESECPVQASACYPEGDCPEAVRRAVPGAICHVPVDGDLVPPLPGAADSCSCGCTGCLFACDGTGPIFGLRPTDVPPRLLFALDVARYAPSSGRIGAYVRLRGTPNLAIEVSRSQPGLPTKYDISSSNPESFTDYVLFDPPGASAYAWAAASAAPGSLRFGATVAGATYVEVDCVVPFIVP